MLSHYVRSLSTDYSGTTVRTVLVVAYINFVFSWGGWCSWRGVYYKFLIGFLCMNNAALCRQQQATRLAEGMQSRGLRWLCCVTFAVASLRVCVCVCMSVPQSWVRVLRLS